MFCLFRHFSFFLQMVASFFSSSFFSCFFSFSSFFFPGRNGHVFLMVPCCYFDVIKEYRNLVVPTTKGYPLKRKRLKKEEEKKGWGGWGVGGGV